MSPTFGNSSHSCALNALLAAGLLSSMWPTCPFAESQPQRRNWKPSAYENCCCMGASLAAAAGPLLPGGGACAGTAMTLARIQETAGSELIPPGEEGLISLDQTFLVKRERPTSVETLKCTYACSPLSWNIA